LIDSVQQIADIIVEEFVHFRPNTPYVQEFSKIP